MGIFTALALVVVGLLLVKGSDYFIDGASEIATRVGVSEVIIDRHWWPLHFLTMGIEYYLDIA